jgi:hypothetical protein
MKYLKGLRPTPSMVVSIIALVVATAGGAYAAATITGSDIVNNSLSSKKVKDNTLKAKDLNKKFLASLEGSDGTNGANGAAGAAGAAGQNGTNGTNGTNGAKGGNVVGPVKFESPGYTLGDIGGQQGWEEDHAFDAEVDSVSQFSNASGFGFGAQALRISDSHTSGAFADQTYSPGAGDEAGESGSDNAGFGSGDRQSHFETSFSIGSTQSGVQPGMHLSVSPDSGNGGRMSYLRFDDLSDGIHVFFQEATDPGPLGTEADFPETDLVTLSRNQAHTVRISMDFVDGPDNDVVQIYIDGVLLKTAGSWEDYYRFDPEQNGGGNKVPTVDKVEFREGGANDVANDGKGYLIDNFSQETSTP